MQTVAINKIFHPKVSIVIPAYNASNYLAEAIDSALAQTYDNIEIIVVNDGSNDDGATAEVAKKYSERIRYFEKTNGGSSSALNVGIRNMTGEWFSWLSHDDLYSPQKVETQIAYLNNLRLPIDEVSRHVCFSASDLIDEAGKTIYKAELNKSQAMSVQLEIIKDNAGLIAEPTKYSFNGCSCLIHRRVFETIGVFDEKLRLLNDVDMWFRIYATGYRIHYIPEALVKGRVHAKQVSRSIGFSYHNVEQDMFWARSFEWLKDNCPQRTDLFFAYGRNAFLKTRDVDGDKAFAYIKSIMQKQKYSLDLKRLVFKTRASMRSFCKKIYMKVRM